MAVDYKQKGSGRESRLWAAGPSRNTSLAVYGVAVYFATHCCCGRRAKNRQRRPRSLKEKEACLQVFCLVRSNPASYLYF